MSNHSPIASRLRDRHPLQNRVHADGSLHAVPARGTLMGNRGGAFHACTDGLPCIRNAARPWVNTQWIACVLAFKDRRRTIWSKGYTELFFLDEVTALSAGHRPCFECRRADAKSFQMAMFKAHGHESGWSDQPRAKQMDTMLHAARLEPSGQMQALGALPVGAMVRLHRDVLARGPHGLLRWTFDGYHAHHGRNDETRVQVLTPEPILGVLAAGYAPHWHPSAFG